MIIWSKKMKLFFMLLLFIFPLTVSAIPPNEYLFIELAKDVGEQHIYKNSAMGGRIISRDFSGTYRFEHRQLVYDWNEDFDPFGMPFDLNRIQAIIGRPDVRRLYPVHETPTTIQFRRGVPEQQYVGKNEQQPHLDTLNLLHIEDSGVAEIEFAGEKFTLAIDESMQFSRTMLFIPRDDTTDAEYPEGYKGIAAVIYTIKDKITNRGFAKKENFIQHIYPDIDGDRLAYVSNRYGEADIFLYNLTTETEKRITTKEADPWHPTLSGDWLLWYDRRHGEPPERPRTRWDIYAYNLMEEREIRVTTETDTWYLAYIAIDGNWLAYATERYFPPKGERLEDYVQPMMYIKLQNLRTGEQCVLTDSAHRSFKPFFHNGEVIWEGDERETPGYYAYNPVTQQQRMLPLELSDKERELFREYGSIFLWHREQTWCHVPIERIVAVDGTRVLWHYDFQRYSLYLDEQNAKQWVEIAYASSQNRLNNKPQADIAGDDIVWSDRHIRSNEIYIYNLRTHKWRRLELE
jgi:beta propeller repeat protein